MLVLLAKHLSVILSICVVFWAAAAGYLGADGSETGNLLLHIHTFNLQELGVLC